jgi:hypothetical protein
VPKNQAATALLFGVIGRTDPPVAGPITVGVAFPADRSVPGLETRL